MFSIRKWKKVADNPSCLHSNSTRILKGTQRLISHLFSPNHPIGLTLQFIIPFLGEKWCTDDINIFLNWVATIRYGLWWFSLSYHFDKPPSLPFEWAKKLSLYAYVLYVYRQKFLYIMKLFCKFSLWVTSTIGKLCLHQANNVAISLSWRHQRVFNKNCKIFPLKYFLSSFLSKTDISRRWLSCAYFHFSVPFMITPGW